MLHTVPSVNHSPIDDAFFNRNWVRACWGRWAGPGSLAGWSAGSGRGHSLQKARKKGVGERFARGRSDA